MSRNSSLSTLFHNPYNGQSPSPPFMTSSIDFKTGQTDIETSAISSASGQSRSTNPLFAFGTESHREGGRVVANRYPSVHHHGEHTATMRDSMDIDSFAHQKQFHGLLKTTEGPSVPYKGGKLSLRPQQVGLPPNEQLKFKFFDKLRQNSGNPNMVMSRIAPVVEQPTVTPQTISSFQPRNSSKSFAGIEGSPVPSKQQLCLKTQPGERTPEPLPHHRQEIATGSLSPEKLANVSAISEYYGSPVLGGAIHPRSSMTGAPSFQNGMRASTGMYSSPQTGRQLLQTIQGSAFSLQQQNGPVLSSRINVGLGKPIFRPSPSIMVGRSQLVGTNYSQVFASPTVPEFATTMHRTLQKDRIVDAPATASSPRFLKLSASMPKIPYCGSPNSAHILFPMSGVRSSSQVAQKPVTAPPPGDLAQPAKCLVSNVTFEHDNAGSAIPSRTLRFANKPDRESMLHSVSKQSLSDTQSRNGSVALSQVRGNKDRGVTDTSVDFHPFVGQRTTDYGTPGRWTPSTMAEGGMIRSAVHPSSSQYMMDSPLKHKSPGPQAAYKPLTTRINRGRPWTCQTSPVQIPPVRDSGSKPLAEHTGISKYLKSLKPVGENSAATIGQNTDKNSNTTEFR